MPLRRRLLILLVALGTAVVVSVSMLKQPAGTQRALPAPAAPPADTARCVGAQTEACLGGKAEVILVGPTQPAPPR